MRSKGVRVVKIWDYEDIKRLELDNVGAIRTASGSEEGAKEAGITYLPFILIDLLPYCVTCVVDARSLFGGD